MLGQIEAEFYMFADQDDVWLPEKIREICEDDNREKRGTASRGGSRTALRVY